MLDETKVEVPEIEYTEEEVVDSEIPNLEDMEEVALRALGRIPLQELINDSVAALVEVYKARPESYYYDASHYDDEDVENPNPFMDLIQYLKEIHSVESDRDSTA